MASRLMLLKQLPRRMLNNMQLLRAICSRTQTAQQQSEHVTTESENEPGDDEKYLHFKAGDYSHMIEQNLVKKKQLRPFFHQLNSRLQSGDKNIPKHLTPEQVLLILELPSWTKRRRQLRYIAAKQEQEYRHKHPKSPKKFDVPLLKGWTSTDEIDKYGLFRNGIFLRMPKYQMYSELEKRLVYSMPFAQKIALDFAYDHVMTPRERNKVCIDVKQLLSRNRWSPNPLNIILCNFECKPGSTARLVQTLFSNRKTPSLLETTSQSVCNIFPKESVIYLSPEGDEVLEKLDPNTVYVLGAHVDKTYAPGASAQRAKELGVKSMRFPAKFFLRWMKDEVEPREEQVPEKPLHLTHCVKLLLNLTSGCSWEEAVRNLDKNLEIEF